MHIKPPVDTFILKLTNTLVNRIKNPTHVNHIKTQAQLHPYWKDYNDLKLIGSRKVKIRAFPFYRCAIYFYSF